MTHPSPEPSSAFPDPNLAPPQPLGAKPPSHTQASSDDRPLGTPRPLGAVVFWSGLTGLAYYGYYKWQIQDELRQYTGHDWSGAVALLPFLLGVTLPPALAVFDPDVPRAFGWLFLLGVAWIYIVQFRLYRTINRLYREAGMAAPLKVWWMVIPGLNIWVGLRQIHFLSQYWAMRRGEPIHDRLVETVPFLFAPE